MTFRWCNGERQYFIILSDYLGDLVERGEYDRTAAIETALDVCYFNIKRRLGL